MALFWFKTYYVLVIIPVMNIATLFSGVGIDEFYLSKYGFKVVLAEELLPSRVKAYKELHENQNVLCGDICDPALQAEIVRQCLDKKVDLILATPPCQGFSTAGANKSKTEILDDPRNFLALQAVAIIQKVSPNFAIFENVPRFGKMLFPLSGELVSFRQYLDFVFGKTYDIKEDIFDSQFFKVPQTRERIIFRLFKKGLTWKDPIKEKPITLEEAIGNLPSLEPGQSSQIKNHFARKAPENHTLWMKHTPTGCTAFDNPVFFPQKSVGTKISGFKNTYKRMRWDAPAHTITMRNEIVSSQQNVHPGRKLSDGTYSDPRVLTLREILIVSSIPPEINPPSSLSEPAFRQVIGEGIPPLMLAKIMKGAKK